MFALHCFTFPSLFVQLCPNPNLPARFSTVINCFSMIINCFEFEKLLIEVAIQSTSPLMVSVRSLKRVRVFKMGTSFFLFGRMPEMVYNTSSRLNEVGVSQL